MKLRLEHAPFAAAVADAARALPARPPAPVLAGRSVKRPVPSRPPAIRSLGPLPEGLSYSDLLPE